MVHVLLRGVRATQGQEIRVAGRPVAVMGLATPTRWKDTEVIAGDVYGISWVAEKEISSALATFRKSPEVVDAMSDPLDRDSTRRRKKLP
jgi:hypothetical protein